MDQSVKSISMQIYTELKQIALVAFTNDAWVAEDSQGIAPFKDDIAEQAARHLPRRSVEHLSSSYHKEISSNV